MTGIPWTSKKTPEESSLEVTALRTLAEMEEVLELQRQIWGYGGPAADYPYPARALFALSESGGLVAAARKGGRLVGFSLGWLGRDRQMGTWYLHSQMTGVLESCRHLNVGYHLKRFQREFALAQGLQLVRWTFDPLQAANANLNLRKLGAVVQTFLPNYYGTLESRFSSGFESDRVWADWYIRSARVCRRLEGLPPAWQPVDLPKVTRVQGDRIVSVDLSCDGPQLQVEIHRDFDWLRRNQPHLAGEWRARIRSVLLHYFGQGFRACEFVPGPEHPAYILRRVSVEELLEGK